MAFVNRVADAAERLGNHDSDLLALIDRENVEHAIQRPGRIARVQSRQNKVTRFRRLEGNLDRLAVAHFANQNHFGRLSQRRPESRCEAGRVAMQLALMHRPLLVRVQEFDRIFDGEDVLGARFVDLINQGGQRRRLP